MQVNAETLQKKIRRLELIKVSGGGLIALSLNEEYQLEAYKMLLALMDRYEDLLAAHAELLEVYDEREYD